MLTPAAARARILAALTDLAPLPGERVPLADALGRSLADDLVAPCDLPAFDAATMDGYALRAADAHRAGARLPVAFEVFAGQVPPPLPEGRCCRFFTGAPLPEGADAVEQQEQVRRAGRTAVTFVRPAERWRFVRRRGSDLAAGQAAVWGGATLDPGTIALAAAVGHPEVLVHRRPRVAVLPTGDELVPVGRTPGPGQIVETNGHAISAAVRDAGGVPVLLPPVGDEPATLRRALESARDADVLLTTGGVSIGARDLVRSVLKDAGARLDFWRVALRPGKPFTFGRWGRTVVFGLPGNPASALVTFELFGRPALRALAGLPGDGRVHATVRLAAAQQKPAELTVYLRARLRRDRSGLVADPLRSQTSGDLSSAVGLDALAILPAGRTHLARGAEVEAIVLRPPPGV